MLLVHPTKHATLRSFFSTDRPGPQIGLHCLSTGHGAAFVDRWPDPRAIAVGGWQNYALAGDASVLSPADLEGFLQGYVDASSDFEPLLRQTWPELDLWQRVVYSLPDGVHHPPDSQVLTRRLGKDDVHRLWGLHPDNHWISDAFDGPRGLVETGLAWGAFVGERLASVATPFFIGDRYEDIGVVTEPCFRGRGLSPAAVAQVVADVRRRGRIPSWTTAHDNHAARRVAEKLGFVHERYDWLFVVDWEVPESARPPVQFKEPDGG